MRKYLVYAHNYSGPKVYDTYEEAEIVAKKIAQKAFQQGYDEVGIYEMVAKATAPVPPIEFVKVQSEPLAA